MTDDRTGWQIHDQNLPLLTTRYGPQQVRMLVFGLRGGGLCAVSPAPHLDDARWQALQAFGTPQFLLAPNHFHNMGLQPWHQRFPATQVVAHPRALARLHKRLPGLPLTDLAPLQAALPDGVRLFSPPMAKQGETWVSLRTSAGTAWYVTDGVVNEKSLTGAVGLFLRLLGFRAELMVNPLFKRLFLQDKAAYAQWLLDELDRDPPTLLLPAHGQVLRGPDVAEQLRQAAKRS